MALHAVGVWGWLMPGGTGPGVDTTSAVTAGTELLGSEGTGLSHPGLPQSHSAGDGGSGDAAVLSSFMLNP